MKRLLIILPLLTFLLWPMAKVEKRFVKPCLVQTTSGKVVLSGKVVKSHPTTTSYVGNSDPGLFITAITPGTIHHDWSPYFVGNGAGGFGWFTPETPKSVKALCRYKNAGSSHQHLLYIIDDVDPCGNVQTTVTVDMSIGNTGDWICANLSSPWAGQPFTSYNTLSSEDNAGDGWMWEDTAVNTYHSEWTYTGITWTTYANNGTPACTTVAGSAGVNHEWTGVNMIFIP